NASIGGKPGEMPKPIDVRKPAMDTVKPGTDTPKMATAIDPTKPATSKAMPKTAVVASKNTGGSYWVQVGAFKNQATAKALAARLRGQNYTVVGSVKDAGGATPSASAHTARAHRP